MEQAMTKWIFYAFITVLMTGCSMNYFQPPPDAWEYFYKHKRGDTPFEVVKQDMLACGFDNPYSSYIKANDEYDTQYINAVLCMERKEYRKESIEESTICLNPAYEKEPACQKHLGQ